MTHFSPELVESGRRVLGIEDLNLTCDLFRIECYIHPPWRLLWELSQTPGLTLDEVDRRSRTKRSSERARKARR